MSEDPGMNEIDMQTVSQAFTLCWHAAGQHLQNSAQGPIESWLRAHLNPPFLDHLSFRLGNQLFFIRIEDLDGALEVPGNRSGLIAIASGCNGHACLMPMRQRGGGWQPVQPGWGLLDLQSRLPVLPPSLVSEEKIEMTDWELHDFAVQVVRDQIAKSGQQLMSWQGNPSVDPSIWFVGENGPEWVVVRSARFPTREALPPSNLNTIKARCSRISTVGHFASVGVASSNDAFDPQGIIPSTPLWRGHAMFVIFKGLAPFSPDTRKLT
jgi:hypothetical protein